MSCLKYKYANNLVSMRPFRFSRVWNPLTVLFLCPKLDVMNSIKLYCISLLHISLPFSHFCPVFILHTFLNACMKKCFNVWHFAAKTNTKLKILNKKTSQSWKYYAKCGFFLYHKFNSSLAVMSILSVHYSAGFNIDIIFVYAEC